MTTPIAHARPDGPRQLKSPVTYPWKPLLNALSNEYFVMRQIGRINRGGRFEYVRTCSGTRQVYRFRAAAQLSANRLNRLAESKRQPVYRRRFGPYASGAALRR